MMLDDLVDTVKTVQSRILAHGSELRQHESRTRTALIDPILRALGWDVSDPSLVMPEFRVEAGRPDYALLGGDRKPVAFLEAKRLGTDLVQHQNQMLNYCMGEGIKYGGLTNGDQWRLYDVFRPVPLQEKRLVDVQVSDETTLEIAALELLPLLRPALTLSKPVPDVPIRRRARGASTKRSRNDGADWVPLSDYSPPTGTTPPSRIRFEDGDERPLGKWNRILIRCAEKLYEDRHLTPAGLPVRNGTGETYIVSQTPTHANGKPFWNAARIGDRVFVEAGLSAHNSRLWAQRLLRHFQIDPNQVQLNVHR